MDETERITRDRRLVKKTKDCCWSHGKLQVTGCLKAFNVRGGQPCTQSDNRLSFKAIAEWKAGKETFSSEPAAEYSTVDPQDGRHLHSIFMMKFSPTPVTKVSYLKERNYHPFVVTLLTRSIHYFPTTSSLILGPKKFLLVQIVHSLINIPQ